MRSSMLMRPSILVVHVDMRHGSAFSPTGTARPVRAEVDAASGRPAKSDSGPRP